MFAHQRKLRASIFCACCWLLVARDKAQAAPIVWDGEADFNWMNPVNWAGNVLPVPGTDDLHFAGAAKTAANNDFPALSAFTGITFDANAAAFTLGGNSITMSGDVVNNSSNLQTINLELTPDNNRTVNAGTAGLKLGNVTGSAPAGQTFTLQGTGGVLAGVLSSGASNGLRLQQDIQASTGADTNTWSILGNNTSTFAGQLIIYRGTMNFGSATDAPNVTITRSSTQTTGSEFITVGDSSVSGAGGTFNMVNGQLTLNDGQNGAGTTSVRLAIGDNASTNVHGTWNQTGGTVTLQGFNLGSSPGVFVGNQTGSVTAFNLSGGTFDAGAAPFFATTRGVGAVTISGAGTLKTTGALNLNRANGPAAATGTVNLNGGTLQVGSITRSGTLAANGAANFNFNGGTLIPAGTSTTFWNNSNDTVATVKAGGAIIDNNGFDITIAQPLLHDSTLGTTSDGGLSKKSAGMLVLTGNNTYTGPTTIGAGTLQIGDGVATTGSIGSGNIVNNGTLVFNKPSGAITVVGAISGTGGVQNLGAATLTLAGSNTYAGATDINAGTVIVTGALASTGAVNLNSGTTLAGTGDGTTTGKIGNLTIASGANLRAGATAADGQIGALKMNSLTVNGGDFRFDLGTPANSDTFSVTGAANFVGSSTISLASAPVAGTYVLLSAGSLTGTAPTLNTPPAGTTRSTSALNFDTVAKQIKLQVTGSPKSLTWTGTNGSNWDLNNTVNWSDSGGATANEKFFNFDTVTFANGPTNRTVTLNGTVAPTAVTVNNSTGSDYTISGSGGISDTGLGASTTFTKTGTGTLILGLSGSSYSGGTFVQNGTLRLASPSALPSGSAVTLGAGTTSGVLDLNGTSPTIGGLATSGTGAANIVGNSSTSTPATLTISGSSTQSFGGIIQNSVNGGNQTVALAVNGNLILSGNNTYTGGTTINSGATLQLGNGGTTGSVDLTTVNNSGTLAFNHSDPINLTTAINGGTLQQLGTGTLTLLVDSGATTHAVGAGSTLQVGNGGTVGSLGFGNVATDGTLALNRSDGDTVTPLMVTNPISGAGGVQKLAANVVRLTGTNSYTGPTNVNSGILQTGSATALGSATGATFVASGATLDIFGQNLGGEVINIQGAGVGGVGALISTGARQINAVQNVVLTGDATIGGGDGGADSQVGRWDIRGGAASLSTAGGQAFNLTKVGSNQVSLVAGSVSSSIGNIDIVGGVVAFQTSTNGLGNPTKPMIIESGGAFNMFGATNILDKKIVSNGGRIWMESGTTNTIGVAANPQPITLNANTTIDTAANTMLTINSSIGGTGGITKINPGIVQLNGNNTYTGDTIVNAGTLQLGAADRISDSSNLVLGGGTFIARGFNETMNRVGVTAASTIDFGAAPTTNTLHFASSSNLLWGLGATLTINDWTPNPAGPQLGGGPDPIFVGTSASGVATSGLSISQLNNITFNGFAPGAVLLSTGELVPGTPPALLTAGDVNRDGHINASDVSAMLTALKDLYAYTAAHSPLTYGDAVSVLDIDSDGVASNADLQALLDKLRNGGGSVSPVPEPPSGVILIIGLVILATGYRIARPAVA